MAAAVVDENLRKVLMTDFLSAEELMAHVRVLAQDQKKRVRETIFVMF
jgi:hypothetical protein